MNLVNNPIFGILITIIAFEISVLINKKIKLSILNPVFISMIIIISFLLILDIDFDAYNKGGNFITFFLTPATVILAVPLYKQFELLKKNLFPILIGVFVGCLTSISSIIFLSKCLNVNTKIGLSLIPKSITTPIGIEISNQIGGIPSITIVCIIITGVAGAVLGPSLCKFFKIKDKVAIGVSIGTSSHALGTTKAMELGETEGAMSSLSIGIAGIITVLLAPILIKFIG
ncbi:LrgB family protein [Tepidibacter hydrothermalis]|uniref:LrgB family protein n=1 Tax=Tepidibacter hydrothermalis TaxID=3036126 RepID=A0ABY8EI90_9FIRM|nr:LrgB family protein [Tepidibacter hydrothermalis]WFD11650.1 LrgB family protein [Tepidibacter hydrothermalis]